MEEKDREDRRGRVTWERKRGVEIKRRKYETEEKSRKRKEEGLST